MKLPVKQFSLLSCHFLLLRLKCSPHYSVLYLVGITDIELEGKYKFYAGAILCYSNLTDISIFIFR
jgi:hypothetical protein